MIHSLQYSIITQLKTVVELTDVVWMFDGVTLSGRTKPFATVEQMPDNTEILTKERAYYETTYRFQIGLMAKSVSERSKLQEKVRTALLQPSIPFFNTDIPAPTSAGFFYCDVLAVTPMPAEDISDETGKHRVYFDVEVPVQFRNGSAEFEQ